MRRFIGISCVLMLFAVTVGCGGPAADAPTEEPADSAAVTEETTEVVEEETPVEETASENEESMPPEEEVVEVIETEARPSLLLEIMMEPMTDMIESQTSSLQLPGLGG